MSKSKYCQAVIDKNGNFAGFVSGEDLLDLKFEVKNTNYRLYKKPFKILIGN